MQLQMSFYSGPLTQHNKKRVSFGVKVGIPYTIILHESYSMTMVNSNVKIEDTINQFRFELPRSATLSKPTE